MNASRPWREVAVELQKEKDQHKLIALAKELADALDEQEDTKPTAKTHAQSHKPPSVRC